MSDEPLNLDVALAVSIPPLRPGQLTFSGRPPTDSLDPSWRLCRAMWELLDFGDPAVLECFRRNGIDFEHNGVRVFDSGFGAKPQE